MFAPWLLVPIACGLDRLIGDPPWCPHPVQAMGLVIGRLRSAAERWAGDQPGRLRMAGLLIAVLLVMGSGSLGWLLEQLALASPWIGMPLLALALASSLAGRSLEQAVLNVLRPLPDLHLARARLAWIVGRDVTNLSEQEILRAAAETASENAVDGLFAPLFWMIAGMAVWTAWPHLPGPLASAWGFKASSTMDSMLGYRTGRLRWLGTAGARLDDALTWIPCRLTAMTLPIVAGAWGEWLTLFRAARQDGSRDPSPNAGLSQAIYAHVAGVRLGGTNRYGDGDREKPILAERCPAPEAADVFQILRLSRLLEAFWLASASFVFWLASSSRG